MANVLPEFPKELDPQSREFEYFLRQIRDYFANVNAIPWVTIDKTGSNLTDLETRNHNDLQNLNVGDFQHLTALQLAGLTTGASTTLHTHSHLNLGDIGVNTHAQIDTHLSSSMDVHGVGAASNVVGTQTSQDVQNKAIALRNGGELTISGGIVSISASLHRIDTQADAATDDLDTINGAFADGQILIIRSENSARTVVAKDGTGNLVLGSDFSISNTDKRLMLQWESSSSSWYQISRSDI